MKGILIRIDDGIWMVKWSDLHSFAHGTHWTFTELSPESNSIRYIKDNLIMSKPLEVGLEVEFEYQINSYNEISYRPFSSAKLIFTEVDEFEKEEHIKEYLKNRGDWGDICKVLDIPYSNGNLPTTEEIKIKLRDVIFQPYTNFYIDTTEDQLAVVENAFITGIVYGANYPIQEKKMIKNGFLEKKGEEWGVNWSDYHFYSQETEYIWTQLHTTETISGAYKHNDHVEFEFIIIGYDEKTFSPIRRAKLI